MKLRTLARLAVIVSVVSLCVAIGVYSYLRLQAEESRRGFNLYELVPADVEAVLETQCLDEFVADINQMACSRNGQYLYVSELFACLKNYIQPLADQAPHGLSRQMNKMLISFHAPDTPLNQVLYCTLGKDDEELMDSFISRFSSTHFPSKTFKYRGERIFIYPMNSGQFLSVFKTRKFFVVSFQKRLIEQVIDTYRHGTSLYDAEAFSDMVKQHKGHVEATVFLRMKQVEMGNGVDSLRLVSKLGGWTSFDISLKENAAYVSGVSMATDTTRTLLNAFRQQQPIQELNGNVLPASTFFYNQCALSHKASMLDFAKAQVYSKKSRDSYLCARDEEWRDFIDTHVGNDFFSCLFESADTSTVVPHAVASLPLIDAPRAEQQLRRLLATVPADTAARYTGYVKAEPRRYINWRYRAYLLPRSTVFAQLTGIYNDRRCYAAFYEGRLLLAPDFESLDAYIDALSGGQVLEGAPEFEESVGSLSSKYQYLMWADMDRMADLPVDYAKLIPTFFYRHPEFFQHFLLGFQVSCTDEGVYPNVVLLYQDEQ